MQGYSHVTLKYVKKDQTMLLRKTITLRVLSHQAKTKAKEKKIKEQVEKIREKLAIDEVPGGTV